MADPGFDKPENAPRFAADVVKAVKENEGVELDYSVKSLETIDGLVGRFRENGCTVEDMEITLFIFGCYVGEVFVRNAGATWRAATQDEIDNWCGFPLLLDLGEASLNPIGKVFKRLENGDEDYLPYFYQCFHKGK